MRASDQPRVFLYDNQAYSAAGPAFALAYNTSSRLPGQGSIVGHRSICRREGVVKWRLQEGNEGYVPSQGHRRENPGVLEDIRFMSDQIMYDTLSEGKTNNNNIAYISSLKKHNKIIPHYS